MKFILKIWRQPGPDAKGTFVTYEADDISADCSILEMLDILNERLIAKNEDPVAFDHDCREGICGMCGCVVNGYAHGHEKHTTLCQLHMRHFRDGETIWIEPFRARAFPIIKDLIVNRGALDGIMEAGGYISVRAGSAQDANALPIAKDAADRAMDAAACIGCGACIASCPNASAMLFTSAKISQFGLLPQGQPERADRVKKMISAMEEAGFGACTNHGECSAVCPKQVSMDFIARMNLDLIKASLKK